jgi:type I site-specific restriction-modification system R (restriction) subunit
MPGLLNPITTSSHPIKSPLHIVHCSPQIDAVASLVSAVVADAAAPTATNYLLQHAAGSGKSLTIAALAAALLDTVSTVASA